MRILSRYLVTHYLIYYAAIVAVALLVIAIIEMMVNFDHVIEYGEGAAGATSYLLLRLPSYYLPYLIPLGSLGASLLCLGLPARSLEILAAKAGGISPQHLAAPVLFTAALFSLVALGLNETVVLDSARRLDRATTEDGGEVYHAKGAFWHRRGDTLYSVESAERDSRTLRGVRVYERDERGRLLRRVQAAVAHIEESRRWRLEDARIDHFDPQHPDAAARSERLETGWLELRGDADLALLEADARSLSLRGLGDYIHALERDGRPSARYRALWNARLAEPAGVLLFALLGAPLGLAVERTRSLAVSALQAVAWIGAYYGLQTVGSVIAPSGAIAGALPWLLLGTFGAFGVWRLLRVRG